MKAWRTFARTSVFKWTASSRFKAGNPPNQTIIVQLTFDAVLCPYENKLILKVKDLLIPSIT